MLLKDKTQCRKCKYGFEGSKTLLGDEVMCLYWLSTHKDRVNDENHCETFEKITRAEKIERNKRRYKDGNTFTFY